MTHNDAVKMVYGKRNASRRKVGNNTYAEILDDGSIGIKLHHTYVVKIHADDSATLNTGGWHTRTTKDRINEYAPCGVCVVQRKHEWYVQKRIQGFTNIVPYQEGMTVR